MGGHLVRRLVNGKVKFPCKNSVKKEKLLLIEILLTGLGLFAYLLLPSFLDSVLLESQSRDDDF